MAGTFFFEQAQMLKKAGVQIGVIYPEIRPLRGFSWPLAKSNHFHVSYANEAGLPTYRLHGWNFCPGFLKGTMKLWVFCALRLFRRYIREQGMPTLIHAQSAIWAGAAASKISQMRQIPYLIQEHRDLFLHPTLFEGVSANHWSKNFTKIILEKASEVIAVSRALKTGMEKYVSPSQKNIQVLPNFIDIEALENRPRPSHTAPFTFLTLAGLVPSKNIDLLLRAFKQYRQRVPNSQLLIGGDGKEKEKLKEICRALNLDACVQFLGYVPRHESPFFPGPCFCATQSI